MTMADNRTSPTRAQIDYVRDLINELKHDPDWYDITKMTRLQVANLIDDLRHELTLKRSGEHEGMPVLRQ